jgi:hypothetical protein
MEARTAADKRGVATACKGAARAPDDLGFPKRKQQVIFGLSVICVQKVPLRNVWEINALCHASRDWCKTGGVSAS